MSQPSTDRHWKQAPGEVPGRGIHLADFVPVLVALGVLFFGLAQICQTGWMLFPLVILAVGTALAWRGTPTVFLFSLPLILLLDRSGIGPEEWFASLLEGRNPFFFRRGGGGGPDLDTTNPVSLVEWLVTAGGSIACHALACRHIAMRSSPFQTGQLVAGGGGAGPAWWGMLLPFAIVVTVLGVMIGWVFTAMLLENNTFEPRMVQLIRWINVVGGGLVMGLLVRVMLGLVEGRAMDPTAAAGFLAHASWAEMGREFNKTDRWLMWWRLGRRRQAETRWRRLLLGVKPGPAQSSPAGLAEIGKGQKGNRS